MVWRASCIVVKKSYFLCVLLLFLIEENEMTGFVTTRFDYGLERVLTRPVFSYLGNAVSIAALIIAWLALTSGHARAATTTFSLDNLLLQDGAQITGEFSWTYTEGDFAGGSGEFTSLDIPYTAFSLEMGNLVTIIETTQIEITNVGNIHDQGLNLILKLTSPFSPGQAAPVDLVTSFFECCGNGFYDQPLISGSVVPTATVVPVPGALMLFAGGLSLLGLAGKIRQSKLVQ